MHLSETANWRLVDFVWKWAPNGNSGQRNFKLQGEYFSSEESGWYLQGVWQFLPQWRVGLRHDTVEAADRDSLMLDWSPSEYSRLRLQYTNDRVLAETDESMVPAIHHEPWRAWRAPVLRKVE